MNNIKDRQEILNNYLNEYLYIYVGAKMLLIAEKRNTTKIEVFPRFL